MSLDFPFLCLSLSVSYATFGLPCAPLRCAEASCKEAVADANADANVDADAKQIKTK